MFSSQKETSVKEDGGLTMFEQPGDVITEKSFKVIQAVDFPDGPVVKNLPYNAGDMDLIPVWGTKIPHAVMKAWHSNK